MCVCMRHCNSCQGNDESHILFSRVIKLISLREALVCLTPWGQRGNWQVFNTFSCKICRENNNNDLKSHNASKEKNHFIYVMHLFILPCLVASLNANANCRYHKHAHRFSSRHLLTIHIPMLQSCCCFLCLPQLSSAQRRAELPAAHVVARS